MRYNSLIAAAFLSLSSCTPAEVKEPKTPIIYVGPEEAPVRILPETTEDNTPKITLKEKIGLLSNYLDGDCGREIGMLYDNDKIEFNLHLLFDFYSNECNKTIESGITVKDVSVESVSLPGIYFYPKVEFWSGSSGMIRAFYCGKEFACIELPVDNPDAKKLYEISINVAYGQISDDNEKKYRIPDSTRDLVLKLAEIKSKK